MVFPRPLSQFLENVRNFIYQKLCCRELSFISICLSMSIYLILFLLNNPQKLYTCNLKEREKNYFVLNFRYIDLAKTILNKLIQFKTFINNVKHEQVPAIIRYLILTSFNLELPVFYLHERKGIILYYYFAKFIECKILLNCSLVNALRNMFLILLNYLLIMN